MGWNGRTARLLVTLRCARQCEGCCNKYPSLMKQARVLALNELADYAAVCVTGGEPMLDPYGTLYVVKKLKEQDPRRPVYLYTAFYRPELSLLLDVVDGVHFSVHAEATPNEVLDIGRMQVLAASYPHVSFRLFVDRRVAHPFGIVPSRWARVEVKPWLPEGQCPLPAHEDLVILAHSEAEGGLGA